MPDMYEVSTPALQLRTHKFENEIIVQCSGILTSANSGLLKTHVKELLPQTKHIILDLTELSQMDSSGLGTIVGLYISAKNAGSTLELINLSARIRELFSLTNLLSVFETCGRYGTRLP
jgi:anti-sigma B factor antagonist